jgi:hypothetical protein
MGGWASQAWGQGMDGLPNPTGKAGEILCVHWPAKNHYADTLRAWGKISSDDGRQVYRNDVEIRLNPTANQRGTNAIFKANRIGLLNYRDCPVQGNIIPGPGSSSDQVRGENPSSGGDLMMCGGCYVVPNLPPGNYDMQWFQTLNDDESYYSCATLTVQAGACDDPQKCEGTSGPPITAPPTSPTPAPAPGALPAVPNVPGCYFYYPTGCQPSGESAWTTDFNFVIDEWGMANQNSAASRTACEVTRKADHADYCNKNDSTFRWVDSSGSPAGPTTPTTPPGPTDRPTSTTPSNPSGPSGFSVKVSLSLDYPPEEFMANYVALVAGLTDYLGIVCAHGCEYCPCGHPEHTLAHDRCPTGRPFGS